ncbi:MAG: NAD-dependent epimerase/dehydratase family protein [Kofleriaceae bacterium]
MDRTPWIVVGCGYTGARLARRLLDDGAAVWLTARTAAAAEAHARRLGAGAHALALVLPTDVAALATAPASARVVILAPPADGAGTGEAALLAAVPAPARVLYVSSTGVYGPAGGAWVDEATPLAPASATGAARVAAEAAVRAGATPWTILRPAGIYGPGRGLLARLRAGSYRVVGDGRGHVSRIHVDDLVTAIIAAAQAPAAAGAIYNVADLAPTPAAELADGLAAELGLPPPPRVPVDEVSAEVRAMLTADRRIDGARLRRELGLTLRYPSWREGVAAELAAH